jgi:hypothetical protein
MLGNKYGVPPWAPMFESINRSQDTFLGLAIHALANGDAFR